MEASACLEVGPQATGAFLPDYPGCWVFARTETGALAKLEAALGDWARRLQAHGERPPFVPEDVRIRACEVLRVDYNPALANKPEPLFWSETAPVRQADIARTLRLMRQSRKDLLALVGDLGPEDLCHGPDGGPRTIENALDHIARVEWWYLTRLGLEPPERWPKDVFARLQYARDLAERELSELPRALRRGVFQPERYTAPKARHVNLWTARKVLRRFVDHERLHARQIARLRSLRMREH